LVGHGENERNEKKNMFSHGGATGGVAKIVIGQPPVPRPHAAMAEENEKEGRLEHPEKGRGVNPC